MGLWAAVHAERLGIDTLLVDAGLLGHGASGGLLGALMPHMPDKWNAKKQFQFDALVSLEAEIAALEQQTGLSANYRRSGRLIPLPKPHLREIALGHCRDAEDRWIAGERRFHWQVLDRPPAGELARRSGWRKRLRARHTCRQGCAPVAHCCTRRIAARRAACPGCRTRFRATISILSARSLTTSAGAIAFGHCIVGRGAPILSLAGALHRWSCAAARPTRQGTGSAA